MKRKLIAMIAIFLAVFTLPAATFHSVPLDNEAYRIIDTAELRGIITTQVDVRPYNLDKVYSLLGEIKSSTLVSESEKAEIDRVISDLEFSYGYSDTKTISDVLADGNVSVNGNNPMKIGGKVETIQTVGYKTEGEKVFDAVEAVDAVLAIEQDAYGALVAVFHLQYHLAAGSAWRDRRLEETIPVSRCYGERQDRLVGIVALGTEDGAALGTESRREGGILLVGSNHYSAVAQKQGCSHIEVAVVSIRIAGGSLRPVYELLLLLAQL